MTQRHRLGYRHVCASIPTLPQHRDACAVREESPTMSLRDEYCMCSDDTHLPRLRPAAPQPLYSAAPRGCHISLYASIHVFFRNALELEHMSSHIDTDAMVDYGPKTMQFLKHGALYVNPLYEQFPPTPPSRDRQAVVSCEKAKGESLRVVYPNLPLHIHTMAAGGHMSPGPSKRDNALNTATQPQLRFSRTRHDQMWY
ncbi:hypothetical protein EVG20_g1579 [Dentipellis fragilis]|uniref:Uncharacterized protein n=1 Tax=Dentipellis fragilis TaxID=205917 RepID=A0A4Y9ZDD9_9AGAM|nr:hypothetical protein EVG20_g1579 [Dentipellis fragilis]